ncbi:MAG: hypothetical protein ACOCRX_09345, partial [Candidatus Woesearchaeota archaeon]
KGTEFPKVIFIATKDHCFCLSTTTVLKYLNREDITWCKAASDTKNYDKKLIKELKEDLEVSPYVFQLDNEFNFQNVISYMKELNKHDRRKVKINKDNIKDICEEFCNNIITKNISYNKKVYAFLNCIINPEDNDLHKNKENILWLSDGTQIPIIDKKFNAFFDHYDRKYMLHEIEDWTTIADRLLETAERKYKGAYFTPKIWVDEAHKLIEENLGKNWKDEFVVWDCACGTGNLTRDYHFKELYLSTILKEEIEIVEQCGFNPEATKFQYDFLNNIEWGQFSVKPTNLPQKLWDTLNDKNKKLLFFINPPFGSPGNSKGGSNKSNKPGISNTNIKKLIIKDNCGNSPTKDLLFQFMYKIGKLQEQFPCQIYIALYNKPISLTKASFQKFRTFLFNRFSYTDSFYFKSSEFDGTVEWWGILFSIWNPGETKNKNKIKSRIRISKDNDIKEIYKKYFIPISENSDFSNWFRRNYTLDDKEKIIWPAYNEKINLDNFSIMKSKKNKNTYGIIGCNENNILNSDREVFITNLTSKYRNVEISDQNIKEVVLFFTARNTIISNWKVCFDEFMIPNLEHPDYNQWLKDAFVYVLFHKNSKQLSLRNIELENEKYNISNKFFWINQSKMLELAKQYDFREMIHDTKFIKSDTEFSKLKNLSLSSDAREVLNQATSLVEKSMLARKDLHKKHPEYHLNAWDAGWFQIRYVLRKEYPEELRKFIELYEEFENRLREGVYKFEILEPTIKLPNGEWHDDLKEMAEYRKNPRQKRRL